ncbi:tRNA glutamyl-Q(34) synthetase GluQRS [Devosia rhodophyticola]|uniref:tRNA glutamyl-Q(34) synthetase GluQRS n=1 Tax=Devosia rhodophyticola TaxID=3026423 RepID=A0ABY7YTK2_9HYPH|nr:tRNA glutamyl-Q(34) synthetase GluQRS [Devosia rhodophyticola]WDR04634.1 tRNA glutamyl-Q(34) synthetase GluQRS [Devosia rhodophyticola]
MSANLPLLRFAPSPNGLLHLGHAYSALFTWQAASQLGGRVLLRIEDIDLERCKPEFDAAMLRDLAWLGLDWPTPVWRQSQRFAHYSAAADQLRALQLLYPCFCSRRTIAAHASGTDPDGAPLYAGNCRHLNQDDIAAKFGRGEPVQYRLDMDRAMAMTGPLSFTLVGPSALDRPQIRYARPQRWGDIVLQRKQTPTSYHLSVVVDDAAQAITHVTRGRDMEAATDIHILLQFLLGLPSPIYNFHTLIRDENGTKLAKSRGSPSLASLRESGWTPQQVCAQLGFA